MQPVILIGQCKSYRIKLVHWRWNYHRNQMKYQVHRKKSILQIESADLRNIIRTSSLIKGLSESMMSEMTQITISQITLLIFPLNIKAMAKTK